RPRGGACWAARLSTKVQARKVAIVDFMLEPEPQSRGKVAHLVGRLERAELHVAHLGVVAAEVDVVKRIARIEAKIDIATLSKTESTSGRGVQPETHRACKDIAAGVAVSSRSRCCEGSRI